MAQTRLQWHPDARLHFGDAVYSAADIARCGHDGLPTDLQHILLALCGQTAIGAVRQGGDTRPVLITRTGGSSGKPKVIERSQASWIASFEVHQQMFDLQPDQGTASLGDIGHSLTLYALLEGLHLGLNVLVMHARKPTGQIRALRDKKTKLLYATPSQLRLLAAAGQNEALPDLRYILCGGGMLDPQTRANVLNLCPNADLRVFYGATETSFVTLETADTPRDAVGMPYPNVEIKIKGRRDIGEVWVRSPYLADLVNGRPLADPDGFVTAGELGRLGPDGALFLMGRKDRAINVADQIVHPEDAEAVILPIAACAVLPVSDARRGQTLVAILAGEPDASLAEKVLKACREKLPPAACPRQVLFHPAFPTLPSGKPDLVSLAKWLEDTA